MKNELMKGEGKVAGSTSQDAQKRDMSDDLGPSSWEVEDRRASRQEAPVLRIQLMQDTVPLYQQIDERRHYEKPAVQHRRLKPRSTDDETKMFGNYIDAKIADAFRSYAVDNQLTLKSCMEVAFVEFLEARKRKI